MIPLFFAVTSPYFFFSLSLADGGSGKPLVDFVSQLETYLNKNSDKTYLMGEFSTADVCVSIWCASAMIKFDFVAHGFDSFRTIRYGSRGLGYSALGTCLGTGTWTACAIHEVLGN